MKTLETYISELGVLLEFSPHDNNRHKMIPPVAPYVYNSLNTF